jgi:NTP pyrophosphatase (non-canonical NTP hydrolase)
MDKIVDNNLFVSEFNRIQKLAHQNSIDKGFWEKPRNEGEMIALIHSEVSEVLEALRQDNLMDKHISHRSAVVVELADIVIRVFDFAESKGYNLGEVVLEKMEFNKNRPYKHGKNF